MRKSRGEQGYGGYAPTACGPYFKTLPSGVALRIHEKKLTRKVFVEVAERVGDLQHDFQFYLFAGGILLFIPIACRKRKISRSIL